jgi:thiol-disulfide isomerase/thioredoxin
MANYRSLLISLVLVLLTVPSAYALDIGKPAPALEAKLLDGTSFSLASATGKVIVVNFWATYCEPCRAEMPALDAYYRKHRAEGLILLGISIDDPNDEAKVRKVMGAFSYPAALAHDASFDGYGRIWYIPVTFVIDRHGNTRKDGWYSNAGIDLPLLERTVTPLLQEQ